MLVHLQAEFVLCLFTGCNTVHFSSMFAYANKNIATFMYSQLCYNVEKGLNGLCRYKRVLL
jgi:hypothetical protein